MFGLNGGGAAALAMIAQTLNGGTMASVTEN